MSDLTNHLWQSTIFAVAVALATMALRRNSARLRYWLWLAASLKFLIPVSLLVSMGSRVVMPPDAPELPALTVLRVSTYFAPAPVFSNATPVLERSHWHAVLAAIWLAGSVILLLRWFRRWRRIHKLVRGATLLPIRAPLPVLSSSAMIEPGIFGIFHPVLLLPEGITEKLTPQQFEAVLAHELCHARYRDNLTAALHMCVESIFWFHPLVWSIGAKLLEERERDCDESVLKQGSKAEDYAQGIVNVCKSYVESPLVCAAGITGASLKKRIREIMTCPASIPVSLLRKVTLVAVGIAAVTIPLAVGIVRAQSLPPEPAYKYGVVSIHKSAPGATGSQWEAGPQGGLRTINTTTLELLEWAYQIPDYRLSGAPGWVSTEHYDVTFTPAEPEIAEGHIADATEMNRRNRNWQRLQGVLRDRFGLILREETHQLPVYAMVPDKGGARISHAETQRSSLNVNGQGHLTATGQMIDRLATFLSSQLGRPVNNETGLEGLYSFELEWEPDVGSRASTPADNPGGPTGASLVTALKEQLGLRLIPKRGPVPVYVVEKIEKPGEN